MGHFLSLLLLIQPIFALSESIDLSPSIYKGETVPFIEHVGDGKWSNYLAMNLPFSAVKGTFSSLEATEGVKLKNRGEAHITVVTPVEFWNVLKPQGVTIQEINDIARDKRVQSSKFKVLCVGRGQHKIDNKIESTYFLVVESEDLLSIREKVQLLFVSRGGQKAQFLPKNYYPHITVGFTRRDLHESDGVIKNKQTCIYTNPRK